MTSLTATCSDGFNGGLPQLFLLELQDANNKVCITFNVQQVNMAYFKI